MCASHSARQVCAYQRPSSSAWRAARTASVDAAQSSSERPVARSKSAIAADIAAAARAESPGGAAAAAPGRRSAPAKAANKRAHSKPSSTPRTAGTGVSGNSAHPSGLARYEACLNDYNSGLRAMSHARSASGAKAMRRASVLVGGSNT